MENREAYPISPQEYAKYIAGISLESIELSKISAEKYYNWVKVNIPVIKVTDKHSYRHIKEDKVIVKSEYKLEICDRDEPENLAIKITLLFHISINTKIKFTRNFFEVFKDLNLPLNTWPYVRTYTQFLIANMGLPPLTLPFWKSLGVDE